LPNTLLGKMELNGYQKINLMYDYSIIIAQKLKQDTLFKYLEDIFNFVVQL